MSKEGFIVVWRDIFKWEWYQDANMVHFFMYLLMKAQFEESRFKGQIIARGQLVFGRMQASKDTGITEQSIRTCMERLKSTKEITTESTNKFTIITICNYEAWQNKNKKPNQLFNLHTNQPVTNEQPATNQPVTTSKQYNNLTKETIKQIPPTPEGEHLYLLDFDLFRIEYPGDKRGRDTEFENFKKKHKDWREALPKLLPSLKLQLSSRAAVELAGGFVPAHKMLSTYINTRSWELEINTTVVLPVKKAAAKTGFDLLIEQEKQKSA